MLWRHLKVIVNDSTCLNNFINIANTYINLEHWLLHFKTLFSIIISKPNKTSYNTSKMFQPIILLNMLGKLIEKVISERLQFQSISNGFIYPCQLDGLKQYGCGSCSNSSYLSRLGQRSSHEHTSFQHCSIFSLS